MSYIIPYKYSLLPNEYLTVYILIIINLNIITNQKKVQSYKVTKLQTTSYVYEKKDQYPIEYKNATTYSKSEKTNVTL